LKAVKKYGRALLVGTEIKEAEIREILNWRFWNRTSSDCLASRFSTGTRLTEDEADKVEGENKLQRSLSFRKKASNSIGLRTNTGF